MINRPIVLNVSPWTVGCVVLGIMAVGDQVYAGLNQSQLNTRDVVAQTCNQAGNAADYQSACGDLVNFGFLGQKPGAVAMRWISPEKVATFGIQGTRAVAGGIATVGSAVASRLQSLMTMSKAEETGYSVAGWQLDRSPYGFKLQNAVGGAAGDAPAALNGPWGVWINGNYNWGDVDSFKEQWGFDFKKWNITAGSDYRIGDMAILGVSFTFMQNYADLVDDRGQIRSDSYIGTFYGSYHVTESFHIEGLASYGGTDYDTNRRFRYTIPAPVSKRFDARAKAHPDGRQFSFSLGGGYDYSVGGMTLMPYSRADYMKIIIDSYSESGGGGWAMAFKDQQIKSLVTTVGAQLSYALSLPWGVLVPQVRGEWHHQFMDDQRKIKASFIGDISGTVLNVLTVKPDRNYFTFGAEIAATLAHGISAFTSYNMLIGYREINSYQILVGARMSF